LTDHPINIPGNANGDVFTGGKREIDTGGGPYIEGDVNVHGGDFVAGDKDVQQASPVGVLAPHQLPTPPGDFTGRAAEWDTLRAAVR